MAVMFDILDQSLSIGSAVGEYDGYSNYGVRYGNVPVPFDFRKFAVDHWNEVDATYVSKNFALFSATVTYIDYNLQEVTVTANFVAILSYLTGDTRNVNVSIVNTETHEVISGTSFSIDLLPLAAASPYEEMALVKLDEWPLDPFYEGKYAFISMPLDPLTGDIVEYSEVSTAVMYQPFAIFSLGTVDVDSLDTYIETEPEFTPGESGTGGGTGTGTPDTDTVTPDGTPTQGFSSSGMGRMYNPTYVDMAALAQFMLSPNFSQSVSKLVSDPMDYLISLHALPFRPTVGERQTIRLGAFDDASITAPIIPNDYATIDCGTIRIPETWGAFLDYSPYTKTSIYVPFVGICEVNPDDVIDAQINLQYRVYIPTGDFLACLTCNTRLGTGILYQWQGNMALQIPLTGRDYSQRVSALGSAAIGIATGLATGGTATAGAEAISGALNVANAKRTAVRSGGIGGPGSLLGNYTPYVILSVPAQALPAQYSALHGYTSFISIKLGKCRGYTKVSDIKLDDLPCTEDERGQLLEILKGGIYL